ncbi:MAG: phage Gp37/Gp68 family protein [Alicyclobacillus sp.]|nr:phage Gp37/Gp68 family protein [Alicyclobacillus sp.]
MSDKSRIEWTEATWNPIHGCSKVSAGCTNCYAETLSHRLGWTTKPWNAAYAEENVQLHPERLDQPLRWKRPRKIFVNSMSDLFHEEVPHDFLEQVFCIMQQARQHTFQILTKRPARMKEFIDWCQRRSYFGSNTGDRWAPLKNVWLGVSVENQEAANERIPLLLETPAAVRFLSCEPLLGPVNLSEYLPHDVFVCQKCGDEIYTGDLDMHGHHAYCGGAVDPNGQTDDGVDWVIVGGESGPNARPMHPEWVRSLRDQCQEAGVAFFFKQWGEWFPRDQWEDNPELVLPDDDVAYINGPRTHVFEYCGELYPVHRVGKRAAGRLLDGRTWDEYPERSE